MLHYGKNHLQNTEAFVLNFNGFLEVDFATFTIDGLEERMEAIRSRIQPKFREIGSILTDDLAGMCGHEMFLHIAKHARRTVNPPKDTWLAICHNKRGYKKHPHFQVGLFDDRVFIWLAFIYELPNKTKIAQTMLENTELIKESIMKDYVISVDHMKKDAVSFTDMSDDELEHILTRFRDVKKAEFLIGKHIEANDAVLKDGEAFLSVVQETFRSLMPLYLLSLK